MKSDANRVRRLNQQIDVWRKHSPDYITGLEERLKNQDNPMVSSDGQIRLSSRNMSEEEYKQQEKIMDYFEKNIGRYTEFEKEITKQIEEETGEVVLYQEDIDKFIDVLANYDDLINELFKNADNSGLARGYFEEAEEKATLKERVEHLQDVLDKGIPYNTDTVTKAIERSAFL